MKAVLMRQTGAPEVLQRAEVDMPLMVEDHAVLVRVEAAGVNPVDTKLRARGTYFPERMPAILGCDGAGVVEAVGAGVSRFAPGDAVWWCHGGVGGEGGSYAQYKLLEERLLAKKPESLDFASAAAAPLVLITAWESLHDRAHIRDRQTVLIHAGAGGVGHIAIQLATAAGCRVITTVSDEEKAAFVRGLGAEEVILYPQQDVAEATLAATAGQGAEVVFDTVGGPTLDLSFRAARPYAQVVSLLQPGPDTDWKTARLRNIGTALELMLSPQVFAANGGAEAKLWREAEQHQVWILDQCRELFDAGQLTLHLADSLPLEQAAEAHRRLETGGMLGKLSLRIDH